MYQNCDVGVVLEGGEDFIIGVSSCIMPTLELAGACKAMDGFSATFNLPSWALAARVVLTPVIPEDLGDVESSERE